MKLFKKEQPLTDAASDDRPRGTWESMGSTMTDEEAHRDVRYSIPSVVMQTLFMFRTQMALYSKRKSIYLILVMAVFIPLIYIGIKDIMYFEMITEASGSGMIGLLLSMMPFIMVLFTAFICGSSVPSEFKDRSAYMNMALPLSRVSFCLGKYFAGLVVTIGVFVFAYGMAMIGSMTEYDFFDENTLGLSFVMMILATVFFTSFAFFMGCIMNRGAALVTLILMLFVVPLIEIYLYANGYIETDVMLMLPNVLPDMACISLGSIFAASPIGSLNIFLNYLDPDTFPLATCAAVAIVTSIAFLALGIIAVNRREM